MLGISPKTIDNRRNEKDPSQMRQTEADSGEVINPRSFGPAEQDGGPCQVTRPLPQPASASVNDPQAAPVLGAL